MSSSRLPSAERVAAALARVVEDDDNVPTTARRALERELYNTGACNILLYRELARVLQANKTNGRTTAPIVLKGGALASTLYDALRRARARPNRRGSRAGAVLLSVSVFSGDVSLEPTREPGHGARRVRGSARPVSRERAPSFVVCDLAFRIATKPRRLEGSRRPDKIARSAGACRGSLGARYELERDLSWRALEALEAYRIPPERWVSLTPDDAL